MRIAVLCVALAAGCVGSRSIECAGGVVCVEGKVCSPAMDRCVFSEQIDTCMGHVDGDGCSYPGVVDGLCHEAVCIPAGCGNGAVEPGEACDDGNRFSLDGCTADC